MPDEPSEENERLASRVNIATIKATAMKKGLNREKNMMAARKKDYVSSNMSLPTELTNFLVSDSTFEKILEMSEKDPQDIMVRR